MREIEKRIADVAYAWNTYRVEDSFSDYGKSLAECKLEFEGKYNITDWSYEKLLAYVPGRDESLGLNDTLSDVKDKLLAADDSGRKFIFKTLTRLLGSVMADKNKEENEALHRDLQYSDDQTDLFAAHIYRTLLRFAGKVCRMAADMGYDIAQIAGYPVYEEITREPDIENILAKKYETLPRTHAIAAVNKLLEKLGVYKNTDKTVAARFVEAVTGGNITTTGKDTMAYKTPSRQAEKSADELLKIIGL